MKVKVIDKGGNKTGGKNGVVKKEVVKKNGVFIEKKKKVLTERDLVWDSGLRIVSPPIVIDVPQKIVDVVMAVENTIGSNVEFSIYIKADISDIGCVTVSEEYYIPSQEVSMASVDNMEPPINGFNALLHKHPNGVMSFSGTDEEFINSNFAVSLLWCNRAFVDAIVNIDFDGGVKLQIEGCVVVDAMKALPVVDTANIHKIMHRAGVPLGHSPAMRSYAESCGYNGFPGEGDDEKWDWQDDVILSRSEKQMMRGENWGI